MEYVALNNVGWYIFCYEISRLPPNNVGDFEMASNQKCCKCRHLMHISHFLKLYCWKVTLFLLNQRVFRVLLETKVLPEICLIALDALTHCGRFYFLQLCLRKSNPDYRPH